MPGLRLLLAGVVAASLAVVAAGCGGSSPSAQETWANDVCSPLVTWKAEITKLTENVTELLKAPSAGAGASVEESVTEAQQATKTLVTDLKAVGPPPGDNAAGGPERHHGTDEEPPDLVGLCAGLCEDPPGQRELELGDHDSQRDLDSGLRSRCRDAERSRPRSRRWRAI